MITANSPASQGEHPSNWEAVLWHEFCHVVTLSKTRNKMPRWLSEGISVYEEGQENPAWATAFDPRFARMILARRPDPAEPLSSAFLTPRRRSTCNSPILNRLWPSNSWSSGSACPP